jgi:hypothetical protein
VGALSIGALAIASLAIRRLAIRQSRFDSLEINALKVRQLQVGELVVSGFTTKPVRRTGRSYVIDGNIHIVARAGLALASLTVLVIAVSHAP